MPELEAFFAIHLIDRQTYQPLGKSRPALLMTVIQPKHQ